MAEVIQVERRPAPPPPPFLPRSITLKLTGKEAAALEVVLSRVSGSPTRSSRGKTKNVLMALRKAGFGHPLGGGGISGRVDFKDGF